MSAMGVSIEMNGFSELSALWQKAPDITSEEMTISTDVASQLLEGEIKDLTPVGASGGGGGGLRDSINAQRPVVLANQVLGAVASSSPYAIPVELGTKPHTPPLQPLMDWVRARLTTVAEADVESVAKRIQWAIKARGTLAVGMFHRGFAYSEPQLLAQYQQGVMRIIGRLGGEY